MGKSSTKQVLTPKLDSRLIVKENEYSDLMFSKHGIAYDSFGFTTALTEIEFEMFDIVMLLKHAILRDPTGGNYEQLKLTIEFIKDKIYSLLEDYGDGTPNFTINEQTKFAIGIYKNAIDRAYWYVTPCNYDESDPENMRTRMSDLYCMLYNACRIAKFIMYGNAYVLLSTPSYAGVEYISNFVRVMDNELVNKVQHFTFGQIYNECCILAEMNC